MVVLRPWRAHARRKSFGIPAGPVLVEERGHDLGGREARPSSGSRFRRREVPAREDLAPGAPVQGFASDQNAVMIKKNGARKANLRHSHSCTSHSTVNTIQILRVNPQATLPTRTHADDAGLDLYNLEDFHLEPGEGRAIKTGIALAIPQGLCRPGCRSLVARQARAQDRGRSDRCRLPRRDSHRALEYLGSGFRAEERRAACAASDHSDRDAGGAGSDDARRDGARRERFREFREVRTPASTQAGLVSGNVARSANLLKLRATVWNPVPRGRDCNRCRVGKDADELTRR